MPTFPFPESATILTRTVTGRDTDGNDVYGETTVPTSGAFAPAGSSILIQGQFTVLEHDTLYLTDGAPVPAVTDRVQVRGVTFDIDARPEQLHNPFTGYEPGPELRLKRVTG